MGALGWTVRIHKWIALIVGLQIFLWIAGGFVMSALPIERVRGEHKIADTPRLSVQPDALISLAEAADRAGFSELTAASLGQMLGKPVWRLRSPDGAHNVIDAGTGTLLTPLSPEAVSQIAEADYSGTGALNAIQHLADPPSEYGRPGPVWRVTFGDGDATTLYIDPETAEVTARRSSTWRLFDFFWKLHVMDYDDGKDFNHPLLITAAGAAVFVAASGLVLLVNRMRRSLIVWRRRRAG